MPGVEPAQGRTDPTVAAAAPLAWLGVALIGLMLVCAGVIVDVYRHEHGQAAAALFSRSNPGVFIASAGILLLTAGLLVAVSSLALGGAGSARVALVRGSALVGAWVAVATVAASALTYAATADLTVGHEGRTPSAAAPAGPAETSADGPPGVLLRGTLMLDGAPLNARFLGARVQRDGLVTACQQTIRAVVDGRFEIGVLADSAVRGCGAPGAQIVLWTYVDDAYFFSRETLPWPGDGASAAFDADFASDAPAGATSPVTEFKGGLRDRSGAKLPPGTVVEAYAGDVLCGVTSLRNGVATEMLYTLIVAGPESIPECAVDATLTFRLDGAPTIETAVNDLSRGAGAHELNLTAR